ncbi:MAG TPA: CDP-diacylglycerol--glycerol-3-phosphate 3-phosphatidyltransferase [Candidatus Dormibacteraeota bacterium]
MNLPNLLTLSRLLAIPVLALLLFGRYPGHDQLAAGVFLIASLTDTLDGTLARRQGTVTELGKFLDPLADKLFILSVLIFLVAQQELPAWVVVVIFGREMLITILRSLSAAQGHVVAATPFGKTKTVTQVGAVLLLILARPYPQLSLISLVGIGVAVVFTVWSGVDYLYRFRHVIGRQAPMAAPPDHLVDWLAEDLAGSGSTLAVAESCTGGALGARLTDKPGSSRWFLGGVVAYSNQAKRDLLGVDEELLDRHGAVSAEVAVAMAQGVRRRLGADVGVAVTGIAGPEADATEKPVGLTFVAAAAEGGELHRRHLFKGDRLANRQQAAEAALKVLLDLRTDVRYNPKALDTRVQEPWLRRF